MKFKFEPPKKTGGHFFVGSNIEWEVGIDLKPMITRFKKYGYDFWVFWVPCDIKTDYLIDHFEPQYVGSIYLGTYRRTK